MTFRDREDAAGLLAGRLKEIDVFRPLVLAIPRGGVVTGAVLARELGGELDVVLSRKLRAPYQTELALGAVSEDGHVVLNEQLEVPPSDALQEYLIRERVHQLAEIERRRRLYRAGRPLAPAEGRTVVVTDDGVATGSTMEAALRTVRAKRPLRLIMAVPVAPPDRLAALAALCDEEVCLLSPEDFRAVGEFYQDFAPVDDDEVVALLKGFAQRPVAKR